MPEELLAILLLVAFEIGRFRLKPEFLRSEVGSLESAVVRHVSIGLVSCILPVTESEKRTESVVTLAARCSMKAYRSSAHTVEI